MKHKRILSALLAAAICLTSVQLNIAVSPTISLTARAEDLIYAEQGLEYDVIDGEVRITGHTKDLPAEVVIPAEIDGKPVTGIDSCAFEYCFDLTNVIVPDSVTSIGYEAFYACDSLWGITISDSVTSIGSDAFYGTPWLEARRREDPLVIINGILIDGIDCSGDIIIPDGVKSIGDGAFQSAEVTGIIIPNSVSSIGEHVFQSCESLTTVTISNSMTRIPPYAFTGCTNLECIVIPDSVTNIGDFLDAPWVFSDCPNLTIKGYTNSFAEIYANCYHIPFESLGEAPGSEGITRKGLVYEVTEGEYWFEVSITGYTEDLPAEVVIPSSIGGVPVTISRDAFYDCTSMTSITFLDGVTGIGEHMFSGCSNLTSITIPDSVTFISTYAFSRCTSLRDIKIAEGNPDYCDVDGVLFDKDCTVLLLYPKGRKGSYTIPDGVTCIGESAFYGCTGLTSVTIPDGVTYIGESAFYGCTGLTSVTIPDGVKSIGYDAFGNCTDLENIIIPDSVGFYCNPFYGTRWLEERRREDPLVIVNDILIDGAACSGDVTIPDGVTEIINEAFYGCTSLDSITIPASVTAISVDAFTLCSSLTVIKGYSGSHAETFAGWCGIPFVSLGEVPAQYKGDVNGDGALTVSDVVLLQKWLLAVPDTYLANWKAADFYVDDKLDVFDLCMMKRALISNET